MCTHASIYSPHLCYTDMHVYMSPCVLVVIAALYNSTITIFKLQMMAILQCQKYLNLNYSISYSYCHKYAGIGINFHAQKFSTHRTKTV